MANSSALLAVAGSGKTDSIIQRCEESPRRRLIITYTTNGQNEIENRLRGAMSGGRIGEIPEVIGWYKFLNEHFLKPYLPVSEFNRAYGGFYKDYDPGDRAPGSLRYFDKEGRVGGELLGYVASRVQISSGGLPVARLESIYEEIIIDEVQDLVASDLLILEFLLDSTIPIYMVGDLRQTVYETNRKDTKYKKYRGLGKLDWFKEKSADGLLTLTEQTINHRSCSPIVELANQVFDPTLGFANATSGRAIVQSHNGIFYIKEDDVEIYATHFDPMPLRLDKRAAKKWEQRLQFINFGEAKGLQTDHVLIFPSKPIRDFLEKRDPVQKSLSAAKLYVAITRARYSVAFVMPKGSVLGPGLHWWNTGALEKPDPTKH